MFGRNEITGLRFFNEQTEHREHLLVTSIFVTLQGEGPFSGRPALFIRLAKCNLACSFCDTYFDRGNWYSIDELQALAAKTISDYFLGAAPEWAGGKDGLGLYDMVLVITGGEPSLQPMLVPFLNQVLDDFSDIQIESNGIISIAGLPSMVTLVVSPKCREIEGRAIEYMNPNPSTIARADCLKFVMSGDPTSPYYNIPDWALKWHDQFREGREVFISPMNQYLRMPEKYHVAFEGWELEERNTAEVVSFWEPGLLDMEANRRNHEHAARYCLAHGLRLSLQVHLYASLA